MYNYWRERNRDAFVWAVMIDPPRKVARKFPLRGLYVCAGKLDIEIMLIYTDL